MLNFIFLNCINICGMEISVKKLYIVCLFILSFIGVSAYLICFYAIKRSIETVPVKDYYEVRLSVAQNDELLTKDEIVSGGSNEGIVNKYGNDSIKYEEHPDNNGVEISQLEAADSLRIIKDGGYILYCIGGKVVIYYSDFVTIYDYTDIDINDLPDELQQEIKCGKQIKSLKELYEFLEEFTS